MSEILLDEKRKMAELVAGAIVDQVEAGALEENVWLETADRVEMGYLSLEELHATVDPLELAVMKRVYRSLGLLFFHRNSKGTGARFLS